MGGRWACTHLRGAEVLANRPYNLHDVEGTEEVDLHAQVKVLLRVPREQRREMDGGHPVKIKIKQGAVFWDRMQDLPISKCSKRAKVRPRRTRAYPSQSLNVPGAAVRREDLAHAVAVSEVARDVPSKRG